MYAAISFPTPIAFVPYTSRYHKAPHAQHRRRQRRLLRPPLQHPLLYRYLPYALFPTSPPTRLRCCRLRPRPLYRRSTGMRSPYPFFSATSRRPPGPCNAEIARRRRARSFVRTPRLTVAGRLLPIEGFLTRHLHCTPPSAAPEAGDLLYLSRIARDACL